MNSRKGIPVGLAILCMLALPTFGASKCSINTLAGDYGFSASAFVPQPQNSVPMRFDPVSLVAIARYDGKGMVKAYATEQYDGGGGVVSLSGNYDIQESCVGSATFNMSDGRLIKWRFVVVHNATEIETMQIVPQTGTRPLYSITFTQKKL